MADEEFTAVLRSTHEKFVQGLSNQVQKKKFIFWAYKKHGRIRFNESGSKLDWRIKYKRRSHTGYADGDVITYSRKNLAQKAELPWRGYVMDDMITEKQRLMNRGKEAIFKMYGNLARDMKEDFLDDFDDEFYVDGNATGNTKRMHGLESFFGEAGTADADLVATASDTYAGLSTVKGTYGGADGDPHYDFWTPILVNATGDWGATDTWAVEADQILRYAITLTMKNTKKDKRVDYVLTGHDWFTKLLNLLQAEERIEASNKELTAAGFRNLIFDGVNVVWASNCADNVAYGLDMAETELKFLTSDVVVSRSDFSMKNLGWLFAMYTFGNFRFNPRHFFKIGEYA